jgi:hypothetical protein
MIIAANKKFLVSEYNKPSDFNLFQCIEEERKLGVYKCNKSNNKKVVNNWNQVKNGW